MGAAGFWNDMNEPALFQRADKTMQLDVVHRLDDGTTLDHRAIHNIYGMQNVRATYDGLRKLQPDERPFVLTRAAYSGASATPPRGPRQQQHLEPSQNEHPDAPEHGHLGISAHR